jgi:hypothetical protein
MYDGNSTNGTVIINND